MKHPSYPSTGLEHLDELLNHLQYGDNVVWQVDQISHYREVVVSYVQRAVREQRTMIYFRFAHHEPLLQPQPGLTIVELDASAGFEAFSTQVHQVIAGAGKGAFYVFDSLSDLLTAWATDLMIGNFFNVTCPFLYELDTIAYFALIRNRHSFQTVARIRGTTQLLLDVYRLDGTRYVHPLKVQGRYSHTMFLPHRDDTDRFTPVSDSVDAARLFSYISDIGRTRTRRKLDYWDQLFLKAENLAESFPAVDEYTEAIPEYTEAVNRICRIMVGREERMLELVKSHFSLRDLLDIKARLIGTGYIGGKAVGMLLARKILCEEDAFQWHKHLENHDSFFIGSDIFHTYIVQNGLWKLRMNQKTPEGYFPESKPLAEGLLKGKFTNEIREQFRELIEYFGQSPIIIRSSSLLEDSFGNAFAGKYESLFLPNQGSPEQRYEQFEEAVRHIYASTMSEDALTYRLQRGLDKMDEQMALLVQRVSGTHHGDYFFPDMAGVGVSYNTFVWNKELDPKAGMLRVVAGLGTRAVDRNDDDYPRLIAMDEPFLRPHTTLDNQREFSQHYIDVLNLGGNDYQTLTIRQYLAENPEWNVDLFTTEDREAVSRMNQLGIQAGRQLIFSFEPLLRNTEFCDVMQRMLQTLERVYEYPVDVEFTVNFPADRLPQINLLQCRPLQASGLGRRVRLPERLNPRQILMETSGSFMGGNVAHAVDKVIYVRPSAYIALSQQEKYEVARLIGKLNRQFCDKKNDFTMLMGPGRWGTSTPSLGVPVRFSEINRMSALCEISYPGGNLMPELSYGSHFFMDLVEDGVFYIALFCDKSNVTFRSELLESRPNLLTRILPEAEKFKETIFVYEFKDVALSLVADVLDQKLICYFDTIKTKQA